jgi:hypothetical protein
MPQRRAARMQRAHDALEHPCRKLGVILSLLGRAAEIIRLNRLDC